MFHLTLFGANQAEMPPAGLTALTMFGGSELIRPTLARRIVHLRNAPPHRSRLRRWLGLERNLVLTMFAGTEVRTPTLLEEFAALRALLDTGAVAAEECRDLLQRLAVDGRTDDTYTCVTLFGGTVLRRPSVARERKALENARDSGLLTEQQYTQLDRAVASPMPVVADLLGRLVCAT